MKHPICWVLLFSALVVVLSACGGASKAEQHNNTGVDLAEQERLEDSIADFNEAIRLDPEFALAYSNRGSRPVKWCKSASSC